MPNYFLASSAATRMEVKMRRLMAIAILIFLLAACSSSDGVSSEVVRSPYYSATIGDTIQLGGFDWRVLDIGDGKALVISEKVLSQRPWHYEQQIMMWESSDIRQYLNGQFFDNTFTEEERAFIVEASVTNNVNPWYGTAGAGNDTMDRVFLLSVEEVVQYFGDSGMLAEFSGRPTTALPDFLTDEYNYARIAGPIESGVAPWWWLRTPGRFVSPWLDASAAVVSGAGDVVPYGIYLVTEGGVRPALWIRV